MIRYIVGLSVALAAVFTIGVSQVLAADGSADTSLDLTQYIVAALGAVITAIGGYIAKLVGSRFKVLDNRDLSDKIITAARRGILGYIQTLGERGTLTVDVRHAAVKEGAEYVLRRVPDAARHFGLDSNPSELGDVVRAVLAEIEHETLPELETIVAGDLMYSGPAKGDGPVIPEKA